MDQNKLALTSSEIGTLWGEYVNGTMTDSIAFSQVAQTKEVRKFLTDSEKTADQQIKAFSKIMQTNNLPVPKSW